ncbi:MAG: protein-glutamate O-methyltransferase CheR [Candidatus Zixiibacteriota bacterium]
MSLDEFQMIRDFIHEKSGIYFAENKMYLVQNRLEKRMTELDIKTVRDYFYHVKYDISQREFNRLMVVMTTNETSFYRNEPQLLCFSDEVLPLLLREKTQSRGNRTLRIWSAGCSTGEEPYTLAILILERLKNPTGWNIEIVANDISEDVLQKARVGTYSGTTIRNVNPDILARYFTQSGDNYTVKPEVKALVKFSQINLNDPHKVAMMTNMDVIFCRNVMIYFSDGVKKQIVRGFFDSLVPGRYLFIGHSETLHGISKAFKLIYFKNALVYRKDVEKAKSSGTLETSRAADVLATVGATATAGMAGGAARVLDLLSKIKPMTVKK